MKVDWCVATAARVKSTLAATRRKCGSATFARSFCAFLMKVKWGVWLSLYSFAFSYVNMSYESDFKQLITSFSLIVAGFLSVYVAPQKPLSP